ncbi:HAMP domain-containing sensor histidine kinase [Rhizobium sp. LjRoot98]|uniref:sensor histidine kinase n=1 Tax=Rhizobium sp. LjRoot98 TaxID=3342345 RepID=UPI003ED01F71
MHRASLLRSTPFRLALTFGFLFIIAFLIAGMTTYQLLDRALARQLDESVKEAYSVVASTYAQNDVEDLIAAINTYSSLRSTEHRVFSLEGADGKRLAGNFAAPALPLGLLSVQAATLGLPNFDLYRVQVGIVGENRLVVGQSFAETERLAQILLISLGWVSGLVILIAIGGGAFLAVRAQRRLDAVARTMMHVSEGQLASRIPLKGNGDDIDRVSTQINHALDRLSSLVEGVRQVSADIAHELKTPLNRLAMILEEAAGKDGKRVQTLIADARTESGQINATFEALLRISQIEAGARRTRFQPVNLAGLLASLAEIYTGVAEDNGHVLQVSVLQDAPGIVAGDRELLTQMFVNLIENSITHCPKGSEIQVSLVVEAACITVIIADNGPGIPAAEREKVFRRLYRLDKSRTTKGSGLGLSLVRAIADLHSGILTLDDNAPGVRVSVSLPTLGSSMEV